MGSAGGGSSDFPLLQQSTNPSPHRPVIKALIILVLVVGIFGAAAFWGYELFLRPTAELQEEKLLPPEPPPPDPTLPDFQRVVALQKQRKLLEARAGFLQFIEQNPQSSKIEEAYDRLGEVNTDIFLSTVEAPEKQKYIVKSGDVLNKVAGRLKTTPELIMRSNNLSSTMLRIGQELVVSPGEFSLVIRKRAKKVVLLNSGKFFKQYPIRTLPAPPPAGAKKTGLAAGHKLTGKVNEKIAWGPSGQRVTFAEKEYAEASHWIVFNIGGHTLFSEPGEGGGITATRPPTGIGLAPEHVEELAALLRKGDPVTIEP